MKLLRFVTNNWYLADESGILASVRSVGDIPLISLHNVEDKIMEFEQNVLETQNPYKNGGMRLAWLNGIMYAKKKYNIQTPTEYEVEAEKQGEMIMITKIVRSL